MIKLLMAWSKMSVDHTYGRCAVGRLTRAAPPPPVYQVLQRPKVRVIRVCAAPESCDLGRLQLDRRRRRDRGGASSNHLPLNLIARALKNIVKSNLLWLGGFLHFWKFNHCVSSCIKLNWISTCSRDFRKFSF